MWLKAKSGRGPKVLICKVIKIFPHSPAFPQKISTSPTCFDGRFSFFWIILSFRKNYFLKLRSSSLYTFLLHKTPIRNRKCVTNQSQAPSILLTKETDLRKNKYKLPNLNMQLPEKSTEKIKFRKFIDENRGYLTRNL